MEQQAIEKGSSVKGRALQNAWFANSREICQYLDLRKGLNSVVSKSEIDK